MRKPKVGLGGAWGMLWGALAGLGLGLPVLEAINVLPEDALTMTGEQVTVNDDDLNGNEEWDKDDDGPIPNERPLLREFSIHAKGIPGGGVVTIDDSGLEVNGVIHAKLWADAEKKEPLKLKHPVLSLLDLDVVAWVEGIEPTAKIDSLELNAIYLPSSSKFEGYAEASFEFGVFQVDLDVDSNNDNGFHAEGYDDAEDKMENAEGKPGKVLFATNGDFAPSSQFVPVRIQLKKPIDPAKAKVRFSYTACTSRLVEDNAYNGTESGQRGLRLWKVDGDQHRSGEAVDAGGDFIPSAKELSWEDLAGGSRGATLYLEYVKTEGGTDLSSEESILVQVTSPNAPDDVIDEIKVSLLDPRIVPDWNRDRKIDSSDENQVTIANPLRFWINDDNDNGDISSGNSDVPGRYLSSDWADDYVDGRCDLQDFFPVWLDLKPTLDLLPISEGYKYRLRHQYKWNVIRHSELHFVYTDLTRDQAGSYLIAESNSYGASFNVKAHEANTIPIRSSGVVLSSVFLKKIVNDGNKGVLMIEGTRATTSPLVLEILKDDSRVCVVELPIKLSSVEEMYRWINLREAANGAVSRPTDTSEPDNFPDSFSNGKNFVFVHGYNVNEKQARGWNAEIFKRLFQSGSRAKFTAATWFGDSSQITGWLPFVGPFSISPNYYRNVENSFETAQALASVVGDLPGDTVIAAHSLGNMVVTSAIVDFGLKAETYLMFNSSVAQEAYDPSILEPDMMRHPEWQIYDPTLWSANWHKLFDPSDNRKALTWQDRFGDLPQVFNYYSSGEDVLNEGNGDLPPLLNEEYAWVNQEMRKGTWLIQVGPGNSEGGWRLNDHYEDLTVDQANALVLQLDRIRANSFFYRFDDDELYGANGSDFLLDNQATVIHSDIYRRLLADAIPALSSPTGRNPVPRFASFGDEKNIDMNALQTGWPSSRITDEGAELRWFHSDVKNIAFPYVHKVFDGLATKGLR